MIKPMFFSLISQTFHQLLFLSIWSVNFHGIQCSEAHRRSSAMEHLQVSHKGVFKIALFADLHFGEAESLDWGPQQDVNSLRVMSNILDQERPDFVVYLGDVVTANNMPMHNASLYWDQAISPTRARGIPWGSVFGNHDDAPFEWPIEWFSSMGITDIVCPAAENSCSGDIRCGFRGTTRLELMTAETESNPLSCSKIGPKQLWPSVSNYVLKLSSSGNNKDSIAYMYFLDSGGGSYPEVVSSSQSEWFSSTSHEINPDSRVPEIIFWHIPSKVYKKLGKKKCVGSLFEEEVAPQVAEMGIMKLLEEKPSVKAVFVGHNHGLDWCCPYKKLWLCFARHTGYGGYGDWTRGARMLEITQQPLSLKSWIRMEDGQMHSELILAS